MLLVFSHFFVPTMQLCPLGRSVLRLNTECYFPHPISVEQPRLCRDSRSPHPTAARDRPCFGTTRPPREAEPAPNRATHTGNRRGIQGDQTSADDSSNPSRDWISSAPKGGSSWGVHHWFLHGTPDFKVDQNISTEMFR